MQSSIFICVAISIIFSAVQCTDKANVAEYEIKQGLLSGGRSYEIKSQTNAKSQFSTRNELFTIGKKLTLLENGKELYTVKHDILNLMSTWVITEVGSGKELGTIENKLRFTGSKMSANGAFGHYTIEGNFGNREFSIKKDGEQVAKVEKKSFHIHDTYGLTVYGDANQGLMVLFTVIVDEIIEH